MKDIANDSFSDIGTGTPVLEIKVTESVTPLWAKALPLIGLVAGGYYAYKQNGNIGQIILYAGIGGWVASAPSVYYGVEGVKESVANSQVNKKA